MIPRTNIRNIRISAHIDAGKTTLSERDNDLVIRAEVPLAEMFGYSTELRWRSPPQASLSQGMAMFSMEFAQYQKLPENLVSKI